MADENGPRPVVERLRADGYRVHSVSEMSSGIPDEEVILWTHEHSVVLITHDRDFGALAIRDGLPVAGGILLELERLPLAAQVERVSKCLRSGKAEWIGQFSVVEPARVRRRSLTAKPDG